MTYGDKIRDMGDEELAEFIKNILINGCHAIGDFGCMSDRSCAECLFKWLKSEGEE